MISRTARRWGVALAAVIALVPGVAHAQQLAASDQPSTSGPLSLAGSQCNDGSLKHEAREIARVESCIWVFTFDDTMETDLFSSYGAVWVQNTVDPVNGWCATKIPSDITIPDTAERVSFAPQRALSSASRKKVTTRLTVDAGGAALEDGRVSNAYDLYPKKLTPTSLDGGRTTRFMWTGRESKTLAFAGGIQASWSTLEAPAFRAGLGRMSFVKSRGC